MQIDEVLSRDPFQKSYSKKVLNTDADEALNADKILVAIK
jgi:hypothetical protein